MVTGFDISELRQHIVEAGRVVRVVIAEHKGSTPRETGTSMLVTADEQFGTIGGGALEFEAVAELMDSELGRRLQMDPTAL